MRGALLILPQVLVVEAQERRAQALSPAETKVVTGQMQRTTAHFQKVKVT